MTNSLQYRTAERPMPTEHGASRLRTVTGNRFPRRCAACAQPIPRDPNIRLVVDFGAPRPHPAYHLEHSPDYGSYRNDPVYLPPCCVERTSVMMRLQG